MKEIYLDASATTPVDPRVREAMEPFMSVANPSSLHAAGQKARDAIETSRISIANWLNCRPDEIIFTSGGTESVNLALKGIAKANKHIITSTIEHHAVLETCKYLQEHENVDVTHVSVDKNGIVNPADIEKAIRPNTILISIMYANNEIGTIQPVKEIAKIAKQHKILFHTDACQAGLLDLNVGSDLMTLNASKIGGPKGAGLLMVKSGIKLVPLIHGGGQESGKRSGTENVSAIVGFAKALEIIQSEKEAEIKKMSILQNKLETGLKELGAEINGTDRIPTITSVTFEGIEAESLLLRLSEKGVYAATGSACATKTLEPSHVLLALGMRAQKAHGTIRFSFSTQNTASDIEKALPVVKEELTQLRNLTTVEA